MAELTFPNAVIYNDPSSGEQDAEIESITAALQKQVDNDSDRRGTRGPRSSSCPRPARRRPARG